MKRREFIAGLGGAVAWPLAARAQQRAMPVIGILGSGRAAGAPEWTIAFLQGLKEVGFIEGQNVALEYRWANVQCDRLPELAADLVHQRVSLIAALTTIYHRRRRSEQPHRFRSCSRLVPTRLSFAWSRASIGLEEMSPARLRSAHNLA